MAVQDSPMGSVSWAHSSHLGTGKLRALISTQLLLILHPQKVVGAWGRVAGLAGVHCKEHSSGRARQTGS